MLSPGLDAGASYYEASAPGLALPVLGEGQREAEVAIVGGGFAGLGCARSLQERGATGLLLLEAGRIGDGASGRNGGFVFGGFSRDVRALLAELGPEAARELYAATRDAVGLIRARIDRLGLDCDRREGGALLADWFHGPRARAALQAQGRLMRERFGARWDEVGPAQLRDWLQTERYSAGLLERDAFHFHPLKYARGLAARLAADGAAVFERSPVRSIEPRAGGGFLLRLAGGATVAAARVVLAGGGYMRGVQPALERSRLPIATYVMATEPLAADRHPVRTDAAIYDTRFAFDYYRRLADRRLLWGGRISILEREPRSIARLLRADLLKVYPQLADVRIDFAWGGLMSYARHEMPQLGELAPGLWYAQSFGGHGVAPTTLAGEWLAEAMLGRRALPAALQRYGLSRVYGGAGLLAAQARYSWAELRDLLRDWRGPGAQDRGGSSGRAG